MFYLKQCAMLFPEAGQIRTRAGAGVKNRIGERSMKQTTRELICRESQDAAWVKCPICRRGKLLRLTEGARARELVLFCRSCKHESVVDIVAGGNQQQQFPRVIPANQASISGTIKPKNTRFLINSQSENPGTLGRGHV